MRSLAFLKTIVIALVVFSSTSIANVNLDSKYYLSAFGQNFALNRTITDLGDNRYKLRHRHKSFFISYDEYSIYQQINNRVKPLQYSSTIKVLGSVKKQSIFFDEAQKTIRVRYKKHNKILDYPQQFEPHDRISYQVQLLNDLKTPTSLFSYRVLTKTHFETLTFTLKGETKVKLHDQVITASLLTREHKKGSIQIYIRQQPRQILQISNSGKKKQDLRLQGFSTLKK